ncbi:MAG: hypothetical protein FWD44_04475, partial [Oscillospiraceae bacterium]|nr:hypothetical protein [Oscillospiraceae bacterium]
MFNKELYKETFSTLKASENTLSEVLRKTKESKAYKTHQPALRRLRPGFAVAAAILITLLFTTTVLAATGVLNYRDFFNSVFNNEAAAPYIHTGDDITIHISDSDIEVKLVSAFFDAAYVDKIFFELDITDPTGKRLSDSFILFARTDFGYHPLSLDYSAHVQRINENTVRAAFSVSHFFRKTPEGVNISFDLIAAGIYYPKPRPTGLFIGKLIDLETPINVPGSEFIEILEVSRQGGGVSITYQIADYAIYGWGEGSLGLMKPNGEIIWSRFSVGSDTTKISFNIGDINPNDLALVVA